MSSRIKIWMHWFWGIGVLLLAAELPVRADVVPADILDLSKWKLTLPFTKSDGKTPREIFQPDLGTFHLADTFFVNSEKSGVVFRAYCKDTTTRKSSYPRCELREMAAYKSGPAKHRIKAKWSTSDGITHRMTITQAITALPRVKRQVVAGQIHEADDDMMMIRLEDRKLFVERNKVGDIMLTRDYEPGTSFTVRIEAYEGRIKLWYNGNLRMDWSCSRDRCYFKAGCYTQSNPSQGDKPDAYGEVVIYRLEIEHVHKEK